MGDLIVLERLSITARSRDYSVNWDLNLLDRLNQLDFGRAHFLIDRKIAEIYSEKLDQLIRSNSIIFVDATESQKSILGIAPIINQLIEKRVRREDVLVGLGGGIIQDVTCFISSTLLRGVDWKFIPTTLLSQADSCIGSKSSINVGSTKNILGTFNPPSEIFICPNFLLTLSNSDLLSGVGEIIKVHIIDGKESFAKLAGDFDRLLIDSQLLLTYSQAALCIKKKYIELDEFDRGIRNIFNYGHSFGHAIESATGYAVPHGIAVAMGMDLANNIAVSRGHLLIDHYLTMHSVLYKTYNQFLDVQIPFNDFLEALMRDKKNSTSKLRLILPFNDSIDIERVEVIADDNFRLQCRLALEGLNNE